MMPLYEMVSASKREIREKVARWLPRPAEAVTEELDGGLGDLGLSLPPELCGGFRNVLKRRPAPIVKSSASAAERNIVDNNGDEISHAVLKDAVSKIYEIFLNVLEGDRFRISSRYDYSAEEKDKILDALRKEGFRIPESEFYEVVKVVETVKEKKISRGDFSLKDDMDSRHASLNCYDYEELKKEMYILESEIGIRRIEVNSPTLYRIFMEALNNEDSSYPGRHLRCDRIRVHNEKSAARYQCLRLIDEILCSNTKDYYFDLGEMEAAIKKLANSYGLRYRETIKGPWRDFDTFSLTESEFGHLYNILKQLINVEHTSGNVRNCERDVFEFIRRNTPSDGKFKNPGARRYMKMPDGRRLSAFAVDISVDELFRLRKEIGTIRAKFFSNNRERFESKFPLISILADSEDIIKSEVLSDRFLRNLGEKATDLRLAVYKSLKYSEIKKKVEKLMELRLPISIKKGNDWQTVFPVSIKESLDTWVLIGNMAKDNRAVLISPEEIYQTFEAQNDLLNKQESLRREYRFIGTGDFLLDEPLDITIELTDQGLETIENENSAFRGLSPRLKRRTRPVINQYHKAGIITLEQVYINEDFLYEVFRLDKTAKFVSIEPEAVHKLYVQFFEKTTGMRWRHIDDRPQSSKRIRFKKAKIEE